MFGRYNMFNPLRIIGRYRYHSRMNLAHVVDMPFKKATFGMGCFWANDALYGATPGVLRTAVGYSGGTLANPTYRNLGDHTEVIEIDYNPNEITYEKLLELFWANHEYGFTTVIKRQYMSLILYHDDDQKRVAEESLKNESRKSNDKIMTEIKAANIFYPAEDYHQKYRLQKHAVLCQAIGLKPDLLTTSHIAARLNGYVSGVGKMDDLEKDLKNFNLTDDMVNYVKKQWKENEGGTLYC